MTDKPQDEKNLKGWVTAISVIIPLVVALLYLIPKPKVEEELTFLPFWNAIINGTTTLVLIAGGIAIKKGHWKTHRSLMITALLLSVLFLISYVTYHATSDPTSYGGEGGLAYLYYFILITHIILAAAIVPLVLITVIRAWTGKFDKHRKIAVWTYPLWLYVTITGVLVYLFLAPYY